MYFPYFRGKQFELLAIREYFASEQRSNAVAPIVEPVRALDKKNQSFTRMVEQMIENAVQFTVIVNPAVGDLAGLPEAPELILRALDASGCNASSVRLGVICKPGLDAPAIVQAVRDTRFEGSDIGLFHESPSPTELQLQPLADMQIDLHFASEKSIVRRFRSIFPSPSVVRLSDGFPKQRPNQKYVNQSASILTDDHLFFSEDGYAGFGDYLTIGRDFEEGGSSPRVVVIHLTYLNAEDNRIYVRHFCSKTNHDTSDTAGKFVEAATALAEFVREQGFENPALTELCALADNQQFRGLGYVKKLSMLNHLFTVGSALPEQ